VAPTDGHVPVDLLEQPPVLDVNLPDAPEKTLRYLFETCQIVIRYDRKAHHAEVQATITAGTADHLDNTMVPFFDRQSHESEPAGLSAHRSDCSGVIRTA
jgi:hypothetical protein